MIFWHWQVQAGSRWFIIGEASIRAGLDRGQAIHSDTCRCSAGWGGSKMICSQVQPGAGAQVLKVKEHKGLGGRWYIQAGAGAEQGGAGGFRGRMPDAEASHSLLSPSRPSSPMGVQENQTIAIFFWYEIQKVKECWPGPKSSIVLTQ